MNSQIKRSIPSFFGQYIKILSVFFLLMTRGCLLTQTPKLEYTLETDSINPASPEISELTAQNSCVNIRFEFQGGGGDNDTAKLIRENNHLTIKLINSDHLSLGMVLLYRFTGKVCGLKPDEYRLSIEDSNKRVILDEPFTIQSTK